MTHNAANHTTSEWTKWNEWLTHPPYRPASTMNRSTTGVVLQQRHGHHRTHRRNHPPTYPCIEPQQHAKAFREVVHEELCCCSIGISMLSLPPVIPGIGDGTFGSPGEFSGWGRLFRRRPCASGWEDRGVVARLRGSGWRWESRFKRGYSKTYSGLKI